MSVNLETFTYIVDSMLEHTIDFFEAANSAIIIDDPEVSLFSLGIGFIVLELFLWVIFSFRPSAPGLTTGKSAGRRK